jgi:sugar phosphate isomerase/epimerase
MAPESRYPSSLVSANGDDSRGDVAYVASLRCDGAGDRGDFLGNFLIVIAALPIAGNKLPWYILPVETEDKNMRFGICTDLLNAPAAAAAGFNYIEGAMTQVALAPGEEFEAIADAVARSGIKAEALNVMLPGSFRLTGPEVDLAPVREYLERGFARAERLGAAVQVFGSAGARNYPEGWLKDKAMGQLADFLSMAAPMAAKHGILIAVEPVNPGECNIINTVPEALALARLACMPNVGVLADWYHMAVQGECAQGMLAAGSALLHCHIANPCGRRFPLPGDGADFSAFFGALKEIGYPGRVSIEGSGEQYEYALSLKRLRECA